MTQTTETRETIVMKDGHVLYNALPSCEHEIRVKEIYEGGGIECSKCKGWFCA